MKLVEKIARAIEAAEIAWCNEHHISFEQVPREVMALAALKAMREPSEGMVKAGVSEFVGYDSRFEGEDEAVVRIFEAAIDAAIKEAEGE